MKKHKTDFLYVLKHMTTYLVIIAIFGVLLSYLYYQFNQQIRTATLEDSYKKLSEGVGVLDGEISNMYRFASLVREDDAIAEMAEIDKELGIEEYYILNKVQKSMEGLRSIYEMRYSVIFKNNNFFVSNSVFSDDYENGYKEYADYAEITPKLLKKKIFSEERSMSYIPEQHIKYLKDESFDAFTCAIKMPVDVSMNYDCAVMFMLDKREIINLFLDEMVIENGFLYITDDRGEVLLNYNCSTAPLKSEPEKYYNCKINGEEYYIFTENASYSNLSAVAGISQTAFDNQLISIMRIIKFYIFATTLMVILMCLFFAFRQASFIRGIINAFSGKRKEHFRLRNEYSYIQSTVRAIADENRCNKETLKKMQEFAMNSLLERMLLYGIYDEEEKLAIYKYAGSNLDRYCVVCVLIDTDSNNERLILSNNIKSLFEQEYRMLVVCNGVAEINFIILSGENTFLDVERVVSFTKELTVHFASVTAGVSSIGEGIEKVHIYYQQVKNMLRQIFDPSERFVYFRKNSEYGKRKVFDANMSKQMFEFLSLGQKDRIEHLFGEIKQSLHSRVMTDEQEIMQLFFEIKSPLDDVYTNVLNHYGNREIPRYSSDLSLNEMIDAFKEFAIYLCECILNRKTSKKEELKQKVAQYIQENFTNPNLCASVVADEFSISEKYVFTVVKEYTGKTFNEFLEGIRLDEARKYLSETNIAINKIATLVGFNTIDTFYKAFKRVYGIAPGKWKGKNSNAN